MRREAPPFDLPGFKKLPLMESKFLRDYKTLSECIEKLEIILNRILKKNGKEKE